MANTAHSSQRESLFVDPIPNQVYIDYFDVLDGGKPIYMPIVIQEDVPILFIEKAQTKKVAGILRVFYRIEDIEAYINFVTAVMGYPQNMLKPYECDFKKATSMIIELSKENVRLNDKPIRAVSVVRHGGVFRDLSVFWSCEPEYMV